MSSIYVVRRTAAEQIGIDAGLTVLGFVLGAVLLSWTGGWTLPPVDEVLTMGAVGVLFVFGLRLVWRLTPGVVVFSSRPWLLVGWLLFYVFKVGIAPLVVVVAFPYAVIRDIVLVVRERQAKQSAPTAQTPRLPGTNA